MAFRIGFGFDSHQLIENRTFWLGGIVIAHHKGAKGHSDADVLIHAICDALLGAACLGDIGTLFPDNDIKYKDIDSKILLKEVCNTINKNKYSIVNIDCTICLETPKLKPYIAEMQKVLSDSTSVPINRVSIKAKTSEKMGFVGREEGVSAYAVVLINEN